MIAAQRRFARQERVICQQGDGKQVLLNLADGQYYALDEVGSRIWDLCDGTRTVSELAAALAEEYDAPLATLESDALELVEDLLDAQLLVAHPA